MRIKSSILLGLAILLAGVVPGLTQSPRGDKRAPVPRAGNPDPGQMFDQWSAGKPVWVRSEITDPRTQKLFDVFAQRMHITSGRITREEFVASHTPPGASRTQAPRGGSPSGPPTAATPAGGSRLGILAETMFRRLDLNGDGLLNYDEMPENLRAELHTWDRDRNGLIDFNEFKAWLGGRVDLVLRERHPQNTVNFALRPGAGPPVTLPEPLQPGKAPSQLPAWFNDLDTDRDGQVGLYEWKASGRPLAEFDRMDRNGDGFLTADEVLYYEAQRASPPLPHETAKRTAFRWNPTELVDPRTAKR